MSAFARVVLVLPLAVACRAAPSSAALPGSPGAPGARGGDAIVVCGERFATDAPVVLWYEPPRYSAYATEPRFAKEGPSGLRYSPGRPVADDATLARRVREEGWAPEDLARVVDQFVLHYDVCGTSRTCFDVLQDRRQLSVHFLLDIDGTIYQTLDLQEKAWHARQANARSIGIEIAHIGAYPADDAAPLDDWYEPDARGVRLMIPERFGDGGVRTPSFEGRPARAQRIAGAIHGQTVVQYDFTDEQYDSLAKLAATLARVFPLIRLDAPRAESGDVRTDVLSDEEFASFRGVLGHYHVSDMKRDPGPAFDWERFLLQARVDG